MSSSLQCLVGIKARNFFQTLSLSHLDSREVSTKLWMQSVCLVHSEKAWLTLAPSGLLKHTQFSDESTVAKQSTHLYQWYVHRRPHPCWLLRLTEPGTGGSYCFQAAAGRSPESKPEAQAPRTRGQASCLSLCWLPWAPPTMWQPALPEDPHTS